MSNETLASMFNWVRSNSPNGKLTQTQVNAINKIIESVGLQTYMESIAYTPREENPSKPQETTLPKSKLTISPNGYSLIQRFEGFRDKAYKDVGGVWTIGYGTIRYPNGRSVKSGDTCTQAEAASYMVNDCKWVINALHNYVTYSKLTQNQFDALASFIYNVGEGAFRRSTLLALLNRGNVASAASQFDRWTKVNGKHVRGLAVRREAEKALFLKP